MRIDNLYLVGEIFKNISQDSVQSSRTCPANLGVQSYPGRKLICPVRSSPNFKTDHLNQKGYPLKKVPYIIGTSGTEKCYFCKSKLFGILVARDLVILVISHHSQ